MQENDIPDLLKRWKERNHEQDIDRTSKAFFVPKAEIAANGYDLSINLYKQTEYAEVKYESPKAILQKLRDLEDEIRADLDALEGLLK